MSEKPISPLRRRMIEDMTVRNFVEKTRNDYIRQVRTFTAFLGRSPDTATPEDLRRFQLHQTQTGVVRRASTDRLRRCASSSP
jgi:integrase/recombinase XerD